MWVYSVICPSPFAVGDAVPCGGRPRRGQRIRSKCTWRTSLLIAVERSYYAGAFACLIDSSQYHTPNVLIKHLQSVWPIDLSCVGWGWAGPIKLTTGKTPGTGRFALFLRTSCACALCACALCACAEGRYALFWGLHLLPLPSTGLLWPSSFHFWAFFHPRLAPTASRHTATRTPVNPSRFTE